jgi:hypothetical protein
MNLAVITFIFTSIVLTQKPELIDVPQPKPLRKPIQPVASGFPFPSNAPVLNRPPRFPMPTDASGKLLPPPFPIPTDSSGNPIPPHPFPHGLPSGKAKDQAASCTSVASTTETPIDPDGKVKSYSGASSNAVRSLLCIVAVTGIAMFL